jgi:tripeptide aminopeptidase
MRAYERLLKYVTVPTQSSETSGTTPSTACQWELARQLVSELEQLGLENPSVDKNCIVTAWLPATPGCEAAPPLGFLAHMDTAPAFSGDGVTPILHPNYDGGDIALPKNGLVIKPSDFPFLAALKGHTLITADGSTLLGADDKAGIAEIMTLCEQLQAEGIAHGRLCIAFTPDEEIGEGPDHFDVAAFGAKYAYTVDGAQAGAIEYENFNAASAKVHITGVSVHPGSAKGVMENALLLAQEFNSLLPADAIPAKTEGYEGFFHLDRMEGSTAEATMEYIIRDHDSAKFEQKKAAMSAAAELIAQRHPTAKIELEMRDSYYNMAQQLTDCMHLVENAKQAALLAGVTPTVEPIRGGTDGARLSYMGLPCPNLGTGGANFHGPYELASAECMDSVVKILRGIVSLYARM